MTGRSWRLLALALVVTLIHAWMTSWVSHQMAAPLDSGIQRMEARHLTELQFSQPPRMVSSASPAPNTSPSRAAPIVAASRQASAPSPDEPEPSALSASAPPQAGLAPQEPQTDHPPETLTDAASAPAELPESTPLAASGATNTTTTPENLGFEWPLATRVSYRLDGYFRGPVQGDATVEWLRQDSRYQVHVEATVGPRFAPIGSWRLSSEGEISEAGLAPRRHENLDRVFIRGARLRSSDFGEDSVRLHDGTVFPRPAGLQDPASLLIQLAYTFMARPETAQAGQVITLTVASTRRMEELRFEVMGTETIETPVGPVEALHVKPQRLVQEKGNAPADVWFAPSLQYLPVKIMVKVADQPTYMQLTLTRLPEQQSGVTPAVVDRRKP